jgi:hypothetical protein
MKTAMSARSPATRAFASIGRTRLTPVELGEGLGVVGRGDQQRVVVDLGLHVLS